MYQIKRIIILTSNGRTLSNLESHLRKSIYIGLLIILLVSVNGCIKKASVREKLRASLREIRTNQARAKILNSFAIEQEEDALQRKEMLIEALRNDELFGEAHNNLGVVLFLQGEFYDAAVHFQRAADLLPGASIPLVNLTILHAELEQWGRALPFARQAYQRDKYHSPSLYVLAVCMSENKKHGRELGELLNSLAKMTTDESIRKWAITQAKANIDHQKVGSGE